MRRPTTRRRRRALGGDYKYAGREARGNASRSLHITATLVVQPLSARAWQAIDDIS